MLAKILNAEPVVFTTFLGACATFLVGLGLVSQAHADTFTSIAAVLVPVALQIAAGLVARSKVDSPNTVAAKVAAASAPSTVAPTTSTVTS